MKPDSDPQKKINFSTTITNRPDGWLLQQWKSGDLQAAEVLFDRYSMRLVALVASRLNSRYQAKVDPSDIVQSALGSFFNAARQSRIQVSENVSLWRLWATFARRKMARTIEHLAASKRGGGWEQVPLEFVEPRATDIDVEEGEAGLFLEHLRESLSNDLYCVVERSLSQQTQKEIAESLGVDERTVRRRIKRIREQLMVTSVETNEPEAADPVVRHPDLPIVEYNQFVLGKLIGRGGFGKVYRARMQSDGETVAVKFLRKAFWKNKEARDSFVREIRITASIDHPGVLCYRGYGESPHGALYLLSDWIDGRALASFQAASEKEFATWLRGVCEAIQAVHEADLVHGDLTPANILIDGQDRVIVTDFGFSQVSQGRQSAVLGGTLGFAAPEQLDSSFGNISFRTDIYAIGGLVHWFLFQQPPMATSTLTGTLAKTMSGFSISDDQSRGNENLRKIMRRAIRSPPAERTLTIGEIVELLSELI